MGMVRWSWIIPIDEGFIIERGSYKMGNFMAPKKLSISDIHQFAMCVLSLLSHHWSEHLQTDHLPLLLLTLFSNVDQWTSPVHWVDDVTNLFMSVRDFHHATYPEFMWHQWGDYVWMIISATNMDSILYCNVKYILQIRSSSPVSTEVSIVEEWDTFTSHTVSTSPSNLLIVWLYVLRSC